MKQYGGEGIEDYKNNSSDEKLKQHGGEWSEDINTGETRTSKIKHTNEYPGYKGPGSAL